MPIKEMIEKLPKGKASDADVMSDAEYLRNSQKLITEALRKGYDVLQLDNGDVVVTGTETFVHQYRWDTKKGKMNKLTDSQRKKEQKK